MCNVMQYPSSASLVFVFSVVCFCGSRMKYVFLFKVHLLIYQLETAYTVVFVRSCDESLATPNEFDTMEKE